MNESVYEIESVYEYNDLDWWWLETDKINFHWVYLTCELFNLKNCLPKNLSVIGLLLITISILAMKIKKNQK